MVVEMVDIIYGGLPQQRTGPSWMDAIVPIAVLGVAALAVWKLFLSGGQTPAETSETWAGSGGGGYQAAVQGQNQLPAASLQGATVPGADTLTNIIRGTQAGQQVIRLPSQPSTPIFVTAGPTTPAGFSPGGQGVISTSRDVSDSEAVKVLQNLVGSGIPNAWWSREQTITQTSQPGGVNSAGSFQSNIPVGQRHCPCTPALVAQGVCGPNDDWYNC